MAQSIGPLFIALFVIASINILCSIFVIVTLIQYGSSSISSRLILYLHLTLLFEDISTFPYVYNGNEIICEIMGFIRVYSGLSNVLLVGMMVQIYRNLFVDDKHDWTAFINSYVEYIAFVFPLITVLPFSMHMYYGEAGTWCAEPLYTWVQILWFWMVSLLWTYAVILYSIVALSRTLYTVYRADPEMASKLVKTIGLYAVVSLTVWFFLVGSAFRTFEHAYSNLIVYLCGILYFAIFLSEKKSLKLLERFMVVNDVDCSQNGSIGEGG